MAEVWKSDQKIIGENIKKARKAAKLTQEQFAENMGGSCTNKVISRYEKGEVEMGVQTLIDIAENLEVPVDSLMPERVQVHTEPEDDEMSRLFSGLNAENRETLLKMARMMAQNPPLLHQSTAVLLRHRQLHHRPGWQPAGRAGECRCRAFDDPAE